MARLARRRNGMLNRPPRAWCAALRASDTRITPLRAIIRPKDAMDAADGPCSLKTHTVTIDAELVRSLDDQRDLQEIAVDPLLHVYRNVAWAPERAALGPGPAAAAGAASFFPTAAATDLTGAPAALPDSDGRTGASGPVTAGSFVYRLAGRERQQHDRPHDRPARGA